jgi:nitroreductase
MDLCKAMRVRRSVRTYLARPVSEGLLDRLLETFDRSDRLNNLGLRLLPMEARLVEHAMTGLIGSYGSIKNAPLWIIGISEDGEGYQENFGFGMERFILECTREGLGTCWVGGFFKTSLLETVVPKNENERIVCISPLGYAAPRRFAERTMRALGSLNVRKPLGERVFAQRWGTSATQHLALRYKLREVFELARWAPSASNAQPCHYIVDDERIVISVLTSLRKKYPQIISKGTGMNLDFQGIDAGIGMSHVYLAAQELGIGGKWTLEINELELHERYGIPKDARIVGAFNFKGI